MDDTRCPRCGAAVPADAPWCSLCFAPVLAPAPPSHPVEVPAADRVAAGSPVAPLPRRRPGETPVGSGPQVATGPRPQVASPTWPCLSCGHANPLEDTVCSCCGAAFLAAASSPPAVRVPLLGDLLARSRAQQLAFLGLAGLLAVAVLLGVMALFGALL